MLEISTVNPSVIGPGLLVLTASLSLGEARAYDAVPQVPPPPAFAGTPRQPAAPIGPGDMAIDFTLPDASGTSHMLDDYRGKVVLVWFLGYG